MKQRNIAAVMALSFITFGIYTLFWLKSTRDEMVARGAKIPSIGWIIGAVVGLIPLTILVLILFLASFDTNRSGDSFGSVAASLVAMFTIFVIYPLVGIGVGYWVYRYCQAVEYVTKGQTSVALSMSMWVVLNFLVGVGFLWPGIIQDGLNSVDAHSTGTPSQPKVQDAHQSPTNDPARTTDQQPAALRDSDEADDTKAPDTIPSNSQPSQQPNDQTTEQPSSPIATAPPIPKSKPTSKPAKDA